jgi:hypothetical protein
MIMLLQAEKLEMPAVAMLAFGAAIAGLLAIIANNLTNKHYERRSIYFYVLSHYSSGLIYILLYKART